LKTVSGKDFARLLEKHGWELKRVNFPALWAGKFTVKYSNTDSLLLRETRVLIAHRNGTFSGAE